MPAPYQARGKLRQALILSSLRRQGSMNSSRFAGRERQFMPLKGKFIKITQTATAPIKGD
jgi:hypothetical protein